MTLATHAIIGAVIADKFPGNPALGFFLAFASHFLLDAIPHWDYPLKSLEKDSSNQLNNKMPINRVFLHDLFNTGLDFFTGMVVSIYALSAFGSSGALMAVLAGVVGGVMPDFLQFVYWKIRKEPLTSLQRFHMWIHTRNKMPGRRALSISSQIVMILSALYLGR